MSMKINRRDWITASCGGIVSASAGFAATGAERATKRRTRWPSEVEIRARSTDVWGLVDWINAYRAKGGLTAIPLSPRLSGVAARHVKDLAEHQPHRQHGSLHSWSQSERWAGGAFVIADPNTHAIMWEKPREIADYDGYGFEIAVAGARDFKHALHLWAASPPHRDVMLNRGGWERMNWRALGAVFYRGYACAWFGEESDAV
jgi:uncharacterized protein YkwD